MNKIICLKLTFLISAIVYIGNIKALERSVVTMYDQEFFEREEGLITQKQEKEITENLSNLDKLRSKISNVEDAIKNRKPSSLNTDFDFSSVGE